MLEIRRISFLVRINEYQVEWSGGRREGFHSFRGGAEDDVNFTNETCGGEVLGCHFDTSGVYF